MNSMDLFREPVAPDTPGPDTTPGYIHRLRVLRLRSAEKRRDAIGSIGDARIRAVVKFYVADHFARLHHRPLPCLACIEAEEGLTRRFPCRHKP